MTYEDNNTEVSYLAKQVGFGAEGFLGKIGQSGNIYELIDNTNLGKSLVGSQMDAAGRYMFNHRFGGGHLWWSELINRPPEEWYDVAEHLASDLFTKAGIPYLFDATTLNSDSSLLNLLKNKKTSNEHWGMINGFEFVAGGFSLVFSIYDATTLSKGYESDISLAADGLFIAMNVGAGVSTANPLLIVSALVKTSTILRKNRISPNLSAGSPFDINVNELLNLNHSHDLNVENLLLYSTNFDFKYKEQTISHTNSKKAI